MSRERYISHNQKMVLVGCLHDCIYISNLIISRFWGRGFPELIIDFNSCSYVVCMQCICDVSLPSWHSLVYIVSVLTFQHLVLILLPQSHTEFHADLFPDTASGEPSMTGTQWREGANTPVRTHIPRAWPIVIEYSVCRHVRLRL